MFFIQLERYSQYLENIQWAPPVSEEYPSCGPGPELLGGEIAHQRLKEDY